MPGITGLKGLGFPGIRYPIIRLQTLIGIIVSGLNWFKAG